jgi:hypothetical protein
MNSFAGSEGVRAFAPTSNLHSEAPERAMPPCPESHARSPFLSPPPPAFWRIVPFVIGIEWALFYVLDRLVAAHMGAI